jgi:GntR family transcriptional regulator/MocR family aminotransferase
VEPFAAARRLADIMTPTLEQAVVTDFLVDGHFARHVRRMRALYAERQRALVDAAAREMGDVLRIERAEAGLHLVGWLPPGSDDRLASSAALAAGIEAPPLSMYCAETPRHPALLLGYASFDARAIRAAVRKLRDALAAGEWRARAPAFAAAS